MPSTKTSLISYTVLSLVLLGIVVYGVFDIWHKSQKTSQLLQEAEVLGQADTLAQSTRFLKNNSKEDVAFIESRALNNESLVSFIELIERTGQEMGLTVSITSVSVEKEKTSSSTSMLPSKVNVALKSVGEWAPSIEFLHALENLPTQVYITNTSLLTTFPTDIVFPEKKEPWYLNVALTVHSFK